MAELRTRIGGRPHRFGAVWRELRRIAMRLDLACLIIDLPARYKCDFRLIPHRDLWDFRREISERFLSHSQSMSLVEADVRRRGIPFTLAFYSADCAELRYPRPGYGRAPSARHPGARTAWEDARGSIWAYARWQIQQRPAEVDESSDGSDESGESSGGDESSDEGESGDESDGVGDEDGKIKTPAGFE